MQDAEFRIDDVLGGYAAAVLAKDVEAFMMLYSDNVVVYDLWGEWSYDGASAWRAVVTDWLGGLDNERVVVSFTDVRTFATGDLAVACAFVTYRAESLAGIFLRSLTNRMTWTLRPVHGGWKIVHEHTSAPADFNTSKVMLQRKVSATP
jgi:ketosteroid isomerase-like protein